MIYCFVKTLILFCAYLLTSCSLITPKTQVLFESSHGIEIICPSERVQVLCIADGAEGEDHGWSLDIILLNDQGKVEQFTYSRSIPHAECASEKKLYAKILKQGKTIYIAGLGEIASKYDDENDKWVDFPGLGRFMRAERFYTFMVMKNENGDCYGQYKFCPIEGKDFYIRHPSDS